MRFLEWNCLNFWKYFTEYDFFFFFFFGGGVNSSYLCIGWGYVFVLSGNKLYLDPMLTNIYVAIRCHWPHWVKWVYCVMSGQIKFATPFDPNPCSPNSYKYVIVTDTSLYFCYMFLLKVYCKEIVNGLLNVVLPELMQLLLERKASID